MVTDQRLYFQAFNSIATTPVHAFDLSCLERMYKRRYVMQNRGLELFFSSSRKNANGRAAAQTQPDVFLVFKTVTEREAVFNIISQQSRCQLREDFSLSVMTEKWCSGELCNFDYLMFVNEHAGRSFLDISQYPVFPWVIADYISDTLDLTNPATFRDLTKPVGALNPERLASLKSRMDELANAQEPTTFSTPSSSSSLTFSMSTSTMSIAAAVSRDLREPSLSVPPSSSSATVSLLRQLDINPALMNNKKNMNSQNDTEKKGGPETEEKDTWCPDAKSPFLYGTHYSSPGYVLFYLVRQCPQYMLKLQCGKFDFADRLFCSMAATYRSCLTSMSDVKELIPEFYSTTRSNPDSFLSNHLGLHLGTKQNGAKVEDVQLPPWADDDPFCFVEHNREALECEYVSARLHHWIDLIFGYKQRGQEAIKADNVFYYLTYQGAVDHLAEVEDDTTTGRENNEPSFLSRGIHLQISEFGQCPAQIFRQPHPAKKKK